MRSLLCFLLMLPYWAMAQSVPGELFVKLRPQQQLPALPGVEKVEHLFGDVYWLKGQSVEQLEQQLNSLEMVEYTQRNFRSQKRVLAKEVPTPESLLPVAGPFDDPGVRNIWAFRDGERNGMGVIRAYTEHPLRGEPQTPVIVAVVDTGVDYTHEDLKNQMWRNPKEIPGNGIDDDENGYVDDVHGIDTLNRNSKGVATGDPMDTHNHGTHVAGTIAAEQNNGTGIAGVASHVKIMAIRTVPNAGDETDKNVVESFLYAAKHGAKLINCSFGKSLNEGGQIVAETIEHIGKEYGVLVIAAAGNSDEDIERKKSYPASFESEHLLVVAATTSSGRYASFSNYSGVHVDVAAPGSSVFSTVRRNRYASYSGTSMASPMTTGVAAQVLSFHPSLSPLELKARLMNTTIGMSDLSKRTRSDGLINLFNAL